MTVIAGGREIDFGAETQIAARAGRRALRTGSTLTVTRDDERGPLAEDDGRRRLVYHGLPWGYELTTLVGAIAEAGRARARSPRPPSRRSPRSSATLPSRSSSPRPARTARRPCCWRTAAHSPRRHVSAAAVEATRVRGRRRPPRRRLGAGDRRERPACLGRRTSPSRASSSACSRRPERRLSQTRTVDALERAQLILDEVTRPGPRRAARRRRRSSTRTPTSATTSTGCAAAPTRCSRCSTASGSRARSRSASTSPTACPPSRRPTTARSPTRRSTPTGSSRSSGSISRSARSRRRPAASTSARAGSSCIRGHRGSRSATRGSTTSSRSRSSGTSRS